jgi:ubiquinone/menaquinone biosynthesis C-methylase UbiE
MSSPDLVSFDRVADVYDETRGHPPEVAAAISDSLCAALPPAARLLEVGVGTGRIARPLIERGIRITGLDLSPKMLAHLTAALPAGVSSPGLVIGDGCRLPFENASFQAALFVHIFHLLPDWREAVAEARRVLQPGGLLIHGGEERQPDGPQEQIRDHWHNLTNTRRQNGWRPRHEDRDVVLQTLQDSAVRHKRWLAAAWEARFTPERFIANLEAGVYSSSFSLIPEDLHACAEELREWTIHRYGPLDQELTGQRTFIWHTFAWE